MGPVTIGGQSKANSQNDRFLDGDLAELLWYGYSLTGAQQKEIECYLSNKYGLALSTCS